MPTNNYSDAYGYQKAVNPTTWEFPVESGPEPAPMEQTENGMVRVPTPDPYTGEAINFGYTD